ncbi:MAG: hypothetical protein H6525_01020 [Actinobacteria bacterium]|nr:hypothetical protein [Actinomycetota bacterium]MCB9411424.1 hypothetical protein [Actinomycetota bacterium]
MLITNHVLAGALIADRCRSAPAAFLLGLASHLAMDSLPHWGVRDDAVYLKVARADGLVGLGVAAVVIAGTPADRRRIAVAGIAGACTPDSEQVSVHFFGTGFQPVWFDRLHAKIQREHGWLGQEVLVGLGLATLWLALHRRRA